MSTSGVLYEVECERIYQDDRWGEQNHPDGTGPGVELRWSAADHLAAADVNRRRCEAAFRHGEGTYAHILAEEFWEAMAEGDPVRLREELIQVAAVAVAWVEKIDRDATPKPPPMTKALLEQINTERAQP